MPRTFQFCTQRHSLIAAILVGACALAIPTFGLSTSGELPGECSAYKSIPLPADAEKVPVPKASPSCASYRSYRGIGRPVNYAEARVCAWKERIAQQAKLRQNPEEPTAWVVGGSLILADIYFNGAGVKRDVPLAMRFACEAEEGMATLALPGIAKLNNSARTQRPFEFCDYAVTTFTMNFCTDYASEIEDGRRTRYYSALKSAMTQDQQKAFVKLLAAKDEYVREHAAEVDQGGTIRNIRTIGSQSILEDLFRTDLVHFERGNLPSFSAAQIAMADSLLHREYETKLRQLKTQTLEEIDEDAVTAPHLSRVETTWKAYRDAWATFASLRYPNAVAVIRAKVTLDRYRLLKTITIY